MSVPGGAVKCAGLKLSFMDFYYLECGGWWDFILYTIYSLFGKNIIDSSI